MIQEGDIVLFAFPYADDVEKSKLRPALVIKQTTGKFHDWLICMISSQIHQMDVVTDVLIDHDGELFSASGLKVSSVIRAQRLAVVNESVFAGKLGKLDNETLKRLQSNLAAWLTNSRA